MVEPEQTERSVGCELVTDARGVVSSIARGAAELLAIEPRFLLGRPLASFVAERDRRRFRALLLELSTAGAVAGGSFALASRDHTVAADVAARREDGRIVWTLKTAIAAPAEVEPAAAPAGWAERLLMRLPLGIVVFDPALRIVFINPAARRLLRLLGCEVARRGDPLPEIAPQLSLREHASSLFGNHPPLARRLVDAGDHIVAVDGLPAPRGGRGVLLLADATHEEQRRRAEREFVENASHELRTPVAAIVSVVEALESGARDDPDLRDRFLGHIHLQADRLSRLATSLLLLARTKAGIDLPHLDLVPVKPFLDEVAANLEPQDGVFVRVEAPPDLGMLVDRELLRHAVDNVAGNAVRHTSSGEISFTARNLGPTAELEIADTGPGMSEEAAARAFDRFHRSSGTGGVGLGLAIAHEAVQALGGTIEIDSVLGEGTRVRIAVPSATLVT